MIILIFKTSTYNLHTIGKTIKIVKNCLIIFFKDMDDKEVEKFIYTFFPFMIGIEYTSYLLMPLGYKAEDCPINPLHDKRKALEDIVEYK